MNTSSEVIGVTDGIVVVLERTEYWKGVTLYTYHGTLSLDTDEVTSLIDRLVEARELMLK